MKKDDLITWAFGEGVLCILDDANIKIMAERWVEMHPDKKDVRKMTLKDASKYIVEQYRLELK